MGRYGLSYGLYALNKAGRAGIRVDKVRETASKAHLRCIYISNQSTVGGNTGIFFPKVKFHGPSRIPGLSRIPFTAHFEFNVVVFFSPFSLSMKAVACLILSKAFAFTASIKFSSSLKRRRLTAVIIVQVTGVLQRKRKVKGMGRREGSGEWDEGRDGRGREENGAKDSKIGTREEMI